MAKKIIQMYDKYQSTTKVYPKVLEECLPEDYQGLPDSLDDLEETVENIPEVIANPELAGTEDDLEGLQVGNTKYKVGGGKQLYQHNIVLQLNSTGAVTLQLITDNNVTMNITEIADYIKTKSSGSTYPIIASGYYISTAKLYGVYDVFKDSSNNVKFSRYAFADGSQGSSDITNFSIYKYNIVEL